MNDNLKQLNRVAIRQLRPYFTQELDNGYIGFHPDIPENMVDEILNLTDQLEEFINLYFQENKVDYHFQSEKGCYFLSSLFVLSNSSWQLIQGEFDFENKENKYYHSWLEKDNMIFDPAMRVVTLKKLYEEYFIPKYQYHQQELKKLFRRTGMFTYYEEDLQNGCINPIGKIYYYDTKRAEISANYILDNLNSFLKQKSK